MGSSCVFLTVIAMVCVFLPYEGEERGYIISVDNALFQLRGHCGIDAKTTLDSLRLTVVHDLAVRNVASIQVSVNGARNKYIFACVGNLASIKDT